MINKKERLKMYFGTSLFLMALMIFFKFITMENLINTYEETIKTQVNVISSYYKSVRECED